MPQPEWLNRTINIDTGCVFGGQLTALRYPEMQLVSVPALHPYAEAVRPFLPKPEQPPVSAQQAHDEPLDLEELIAKRQISTRLQRSVTIREENALAALEVMSRLAADPKWLIYLPPTMSPSEATREPGLLEHPAEAFAYFRHAGVANVVLQEKHMGSRAIVVICRDADVARRRFGIVDGTSGICYTRTGRHYFDYPLIEAELLSHARTALDSAGAWKRLHTDSLCLDCELMPWSAKAQGLLREQYAPVGAAADLALGEATRLLEIAMARGVDVDRLLHSTEERADLAADYRSAYKRYCWPVQSIADLRLAPFHILASEGAVHVDKDHSWHMEQIRQFCQAGDVPAGLLLATRNQLIDVIDPADQARGIQWWEELTAAGGEGMVVKPLDFVAQGNRGLVHPALKCRGREYLRIIYGPEYTLPENLERLRSRGLAAKRSLALREFALGIKGLERFVRQEPLHRVHECVFGVLALESEPVAPHL